MSVQAMEGNEISRHEVQVFLALSAASGWMTHHEIAAAAGIAARTVRAKTLKFRQLGIVDVAELFPGHRYRLSERARQRNEAYVLRLERAADVFGIARAA